MKETKQERFKRIVEARVNKITQMLRLLGNCSFKGNYEYSDEQIEKVFHKLNAELERTYSRFKCALHGKGRFSLTDTREPYNSDEYRHPSIILPLPDGTRLRASACAEDICPNISIWLQKDDKDEEQSVCYAEYNEYRNNGQELCIGVWNSESEDPYFYEPYNKKIQKKNN